MKLLSIAFTRLREELRVGVLAVFPLALHSACAETASAERLLAQGRADDAIRQLQTMIAERPADPFPRQLMCRVFYAEERFDSAIDACEQAVARGPDDCASQMWLGRAYGLKAENANPLAAITLAKKVRIAFERAAQLDPTNVPAQTALGQFYIAAPAIIGGGLDKARSVASRLMTLSPAAAHRLFALAAEKQKDDSRAEAEFRAAADAGHSPAALVDLGAFYQRHGQPDKAVAVLQTALEADRERDAALMDIASILGDAHRAPDLAERVLRLYLDSPAKSEAAPSFKVHVQLGQLLARRGDIAAARREYIAALELASAYSPAHQALEVLP